MKTFVVTFKVDVPNRVVREAKGDGAYLMEYIDQVIEEHNATVVSVCEEGTSQVLYKDEA